MIKIKNATKTFGHFKAIKNVTCSINKGSIFGIVGSNGAGKSTLLRLISGVYHLDKGEVLLDNEFIYDNPKIKKNIIFLSDTPFVELGTTAKKLMKEYAFHYDNFDKKEYKELIEIFKLDKNMPLSSFSKGMLRQAMIIIALSCNTKYIVLDEALDGLDAMIRGLVKKKIYNKVLDNNTTVIISSHSLRELEDFCDSLILIHKGELVFQQQLNDMDSSFIKVQVALQDATTDCLFEAVDVVKYTKSGSVSSLIVKGNEQEIIKTIQKFNPILLETVPLSLEEIFTYELQQYGYALDKDNESALNLEVK